MMNKFEKLEEAILTKDKEQVIAELLVVQDLVLTDAEAMAQILSPESVGKLHKMLEDNMGVNPRTMQLRARVPSRRKRAYLFVQVMINGVNYLK